MDDLIVTASQPLVIDDLLYHLKLDFAIKDLGNLNLFLSIEVLPNSTGLPLSQKRYILNLLGNNEFIKKKNTKSLK